jgi:hypothetical protein
MVTTTVPWKFNPTTRHADSFVGDQLDKSVTLGDVQSEVSALRAIIAKTVAPKYVAKDFTLGSYHFGASKGL